MNDYFGFFNHIPGNLEQSNYHIFEPDSKAEILNWFRRDDDFIKALINFDDNCGNFYRYRAYFLAAEALNYFPSCFADVIVNQLLNWSYVYFGWKIVATQKRTAAREALKVSDALAAFLHALSQKLEMDAVADSNRGRVKLAGRVVSERSRCEECSI